MEKDAESLRSGESQRSYQEQILNIATNGAITFFLAFCGMAGSMLAQSVFKPSSEDTNRK